MSDLTKPNYELAFHITSNLEEADVQKTRQELEKYVTSHGGVISFSKDPEKIRLAYPIKHQLSAYFGHLIFDLESPESVMSIRDEVRLNPNVLRFLILKNEPQPKIDKDDIVRNMAIAEKRRVRAAKQAEKHTGPKVEVPKVEEAELEKKLEEIIDKL